VDTGTLTTVASVVAGFGVAILVFRVQREIEMARSGERTWIAVADYLIIAATLTVLLLVLLPLLIADLAAPGVRGLTSSAALAAVLMIAGYIPAILAHYRLLIPGRTGPRSNPEPSEAWIVGATLVLAAGAAAYSAFSR
jgi:hypothetical protein